MRIFIIVTLSIFAPAVFADEVLEEIKVTAHPLATDGVAQSTKVLAGENLAEKLQGSLGETVAGEVGVHSAAFGVAVGRPVIHGLGGARIKTTEDRIDSLDVSVTSTDHAVTVEPFIADRINILKGASTLLYGSGAIGGVVDVETGRIAKSLPEKTSGRVEFRAADNADATVAAARIDGAVGNFAWHLDVFDRQAEDYDIPGFVESAAQRLAEEAEEAEEEPGDGELGEEEEERDILAGSSSENRGGAIGLSHIGSRGFIGMSVSTTDAEYGLVGGHGEEEGEEGEEEEEAPGRIELEQTRIDIEAQLDDPFAGFEAINFRIGINDYEHQEIEGNGEIGTLFDNQAWEARVEARHAPIADISGVFGLQANSREFSAIGEEAFVPPVDSDSIGLFWLGERSYESFELELGIRFEEVSHQPTAAGAPKRDFDTFSASLGTVWPMSEQWTLAALLDVSSRAPSIEELFSNGPHLATQSFEIGDPNLTEESAVALTLSADYRSDVFDFSLTAYANEFDDFIYEVGTGEVEDGLPVLVYLQDDASFLGLDLEMAWHVGEIADGDFDLIVKYDTVDADVSGGANQNLPRIPASRTRLEALWKNDQWQIRLGAGRVSAQREAANFELPTEAYDDLSVYIARTWQLQSSPLTLFLKGSNLGDDEQRNHTSFVKDFAPAPGRRFELGLRLNF